MKNFSIIGFWGLLLVCLSHIQAQPITAVSNPVFINFGMPELVLDSEIFVNDPNSNNTLDANERIMISFFIKNKGNYIANRVLIKTHIPISGSGVLVPEILDVGNLDPAQRYLVKRIIQGGPDLKNGKANLEFQLMENDSLSEVIPYSINTYSISQKPRLEIIAYEFFSLGDSRTIKPDSEFELRIRLKNTGGGVAKKVQFDVLHQKHIILFTNLDELVIDELAPDEVVEKSFKFFLGINYQDDTIPIRVKVFDINEGSGEVQELSDAVIE